MLTVILQIITVVYVVFLLAVCGMFIWVTCLFRNWNPADNADEPYDPDPDSDLRDMTVEQLDFELLHNRRAMLDAPDHTAWQLAYDRHRRIHERRRELIRQRGKSFSKSAHHV